MPPLVDGWLLHWHPQGGSVGKTSLRTFVNPPVEFRVYSSRFWNLTSRFLKMIAAICSDYRQRPNKGNGTRWVDWTCLELWQYTKLISLQSHIHSFSLSYKTYDCCFNTESVMSPFPVLLLKSCFDFLLFPSACQSPVCPAFDCSPVLVFQWSWSPVVRVGSLYLFRLSVLFCW